MKVLTLIFSLVVDVVIILNLMFSLGSGIHSSVDLIRYLLLGLEVVLLVVLPILSFKKSNFSTSLVLLTIGIFSAIIAWNPIISIISIINFILIGIVAYYTKVQN